MLGLFSRTFLDSAGHLSLEQFHHLINHPVYHRVLRTSLEIAAWTTLICVFLGYPVAYYLAMAGESLRNRLLLIVLMPFWTGLLVRALAWVILLADNGPLVNMAKTFGIADAKLSYNLTGVLISLAHAYLPLAILCMLPVMQRIDSNVMNAAATLGAPRSQVFWRIYLPLSLPGVTAGALVVFITALGNFISPSVLGSPRETMIAQVIITQIQEVLNWGFAGVLSLVLLIATLAVYYAYERTVGVAQFVGGVSPSLTSRSSDNFGSLRSKAGRLIFGTVGNVITAASNVTGLGRLSTKTSRQGLAAVAGLLLAFMSLPSLFVIPVSFNRSTFLGFPLEGVSWRWYEELLTSPIWLSAAARSFIVAILTAGLALALGIFASFVLTRREFPGRKVVVALVLAPMILPRIAIGAAMFYLFAHLDLVGTTLGLVIGHTVLALPYVVIALTANLSVYDRRFDEAAWVLGANKWRTLLHVTLPIIRGGVLAAAIFAFMTSLDDLSVALFITGGEQATLPKQMWNSMTLQATPILAAVSTVILIVMTGCALGAEAVSHRKR